MEYIPGSIKAWKQYAAVYIQLAIDQLQLVCSILIPALVALVGMSVTVATNIYTRLMTVKFN